MGAVTKPIGAILGSGQKGIASTGPAAFQGKERPIDAGAFTIGGADAFARQTAAQREFADANVQRQQQLAEQLQSQQQQSRNVANQQLSTADAQRSAITQALQQAQSQRSGVTNALNTADAQRSAITNALQQVQGTRGLTDQSRSQQQAGRAQQQSFIQQLQQQAAGQGPSLATAQLQAAQDRSLKQQLAAAASGRGGNQAALQRGLLRSQAAQGQELAQQSTQARIQEQLNAQQLLGGALAQQREQDLGLLGADRALIGADQQTAQLQAALRGQDLEAVDRQAALRAQDFAGAQQQAALRGQDLESTQVANALRGQDIQALSGVQNQFNQAQAQSRQSLQDQIGVQQAVQQANAARESLATQQFLAAQGLSAQGVGAQQQASAGIFGGLLSGGGAALGAMSDKNSKTNTTSYSDKNNKTELRSAQGEYEAEQKTKKYKKAGDSVSDFGSALSKSGKAYEGLESAGKAQLESSMSKMSDKNSKKNIKSDEFEPKSFMDALKAYSYEYKDSKKDLDGAGEKRYLGIMAQDLEKAGPVGRSMVENTPEGKKVDFGKGLGAMLASQANLNERLSKIESGYGKVAEAKRKLKKDK